MATEKRGLQDILSGFKALFQKEEKAAPSDPLGQKRKLTRMKCDYRVECLADGQMFAGVVVDMSLTGMRLEVTRPVKAGTALAVKYDTAARYLARGKIDIDTVNTTVLWCRKKKNSKTLEAGVRYTDASDVMARSWVKYILRQLGFEVHGITERRKQVRVQAQVAGEAVPSPEGGAGVVGVVRNLGATGCLFEGTAEIRLHSRIKVWIGPVPGLPVLALEGRTVRSSKLLDESRWVLGIQFEGMGNREVQLLGRYMAMLLKQGITTEEQSYAHADAGD